MNRARRKFREWLVWNGSLLLDKSIRRDLFFPDFTRKKEKEREREREDRSRGVVEDWKLKKGAR